MLRTITLTSGGGKLGVVSKGAGMRHPGNLRIVADGAWALACTMSGGPELER